MIRNLAILILSSCVASCIGIATVGGTDTTVKGSGPMLATLAQRGAKGSKSSSQLTRSYIREFLGKPEKVEKKIDQELWYYDPAWTAKGLLVMAGLVPVPLMLPYRHYETVLSFRQNELDAILLHENKLKFVLACGLISPVDRCYAGWVNESGVVDGKAL